MIHQPATTRLSRPLTFVVLGALIAVLTGFMLMLSSAPALAHDKLVGQDPVDGEVFETVPEKIVLRFNNKPLDIGEAATVVNVTNASGELVGDGNPEVSGTEVHQALGELPDGAYRVIWRVVSSDGHAITGVFAFGVGEGGEEAIAALPPLEGSDESEDAVDSDESTQPDQDQGVSVPLIIAVSLAGIAAVVTVFALMLRKRSGPPTDES